MKNLILSLALLSSLHPMASAGWLQKEQASLRWPTRRVALVVGNGAYADGELKGAVNDARDVARTLRELRFDVIHKENLKFDEMKRAIRDFGARLRGGGGVGLFYYTGHSLQVKGDNYLISVNSAPVVEEEVEFESVNARLVLAQMESARNGLNIMILDASRHNPFARTLRSTSAGLARMPAPEGTLIAYATSPGAVTSERGDAGGVYTRELLKFMKMPGLNIEEVFKRVRAAVHDKTRGKQLPWEVSSLTGSFYFAGDETTEAAPATDDADAPGLGAGGKGVDGDGRPNPGVVPALKGKPSVEVRAAELYKKLRGLKKRDYSEVISRYREASRREPDNASLHHALASALRMKDEWEWFAIAKSVQDARKNVERKRKWLTIFAMAAAVAIGGPNNPPHWPMPDWSVPPVPLPPLPVDDEVISEFEAAADLNPRNAKYHNDLGTALFDSRNNPTVVGTRAEERAKADAERALRRAVELEPLNPAFLRDLGNALNSQEKWAEAEAVFRRSAELEPDDISHRIGLFIALYAQDRLTDAARVYIEIQRLKPDSIFKALLSNMIKDKKAFEREVKRLKKLSPKSTGK